MQRVHAQITGMVQGVCFRWFTQEAALKLGVGGWVCNRPDASVELVAEGSGDDLKELLKQCRQGPQMARVDQIVEEWSSATGEFSSFVISR